MPRMGKTEEDLNGLKLGFFKTVQPNSFSKLIPAACNFKNNAQETCLFVSDLWFWHLHVLSLLDSDWGRVIDKINKTKWTGPPWHSPFYKVTVEPPLIATSVQRPLYFVPGGGGDSPYTDSYLDLSKTATATKACPQLPTSRQWPVFSVEKSRMIMKFDTYDTLLTNRRTFWSCFIYTVAVN